MVDKKRLIEVAFPLKQTSIDSVKEKYGPRGHLSGFHLWPARRPLAACRAALIATLLPDLEDDEERKLILEKLGGKLVQRIKKVKGADGKMEEKIVEETEGGILRWGRESRPDLEWFRQKIREAYGEQAPKVLDPFAGGGAIPLEAMRLGCEATAGDINPVAWFVLKCTLEYPQKLAGQTHPLPDFALQDREFMEAFLKSKGYTGSALQAQLIQLGLENVNPDELPLFKSVPLSPVPLPPDLNADLAWHVRAWGRWVLAQARRDLARFYPTYADFDLLVEVAHKVETRPMQLVPLKEDSMPDVDALNAEFDEAYLEDKRNPRWVAKPSVAYLWARTVTCKNCRAMIPLLKTRWLVKKDKKRVVLTMQPNADKTGAVFSVQSNVPVHGRNPSQRKAHDKEIGGGTMSRSGATCPCCGAIMTMEYIRLEGQAERLGTLMMVVVVDGIKGKEYRLPTENEIRQATDAEKNLDAVFNRIPFGIPNESTPPGGGSGAGRAFSVQGYGFNKWKDLFTFRQLISLGTFVHQIREINKSASNYYANENKAEFLEAIQIYLASALDRLVDHSTTLATWYLPGENVKHTFVRYALPITWDFAESNVISDGGGSWNSAIHFCSAALDHSLKATYRAPSPIVRNLSALKISTTTKYDLIFTDPPYYDAIPYSDLMDLFYVWLRRTLHGISLEIDSRFASELSPKWNQTENDGELIDDDTRFEGSREKSKNNYEEGMFRVFKNCYETIDANGRFVIVFANKQPDAWETLVSAIIRAGFVVCSSWPIQTENVTRSRARASAALASSIWLVCKKRSESFRPGWDNRVLDEMRHKIIDRLRDFWDAGIRGPDFVWAATGPALESYSQYPAVKKANEPGKLMTVDEFLRHVRRMVVDFVVGRVLSGDGGTESVSGLDDITTYYLLHRHDFGFEEAPAGACILYAVSCGLSDRELVDRYNLLTSSGKPRPKSEDDEAEEDGDQEHEYEESSGSTLRLKGWKERKSPNLGMDPALDKSPAHLPLFPDMESQAAPLRSLPLIDQVHRLMHLWKGGDVNEVNDYLDIRGLRRNQLFHQLLQALIELAPTGSEERALMESISNHVVGRGQAEKTLF